jgi:hypothetical protein
MKTKALIIILAVVLVLAACGPVVRDGSDFAVRLSDGTVIAGRGICYVDDSGWSRTGAVSCYEGYDAWGEGATGLIVYCTACALVMGPAK